MTDMRSRITYACENVLIFGVDDSRELLGRHVSTLYAEKKRRRNILKALAQNGRLSYEATARAAGGSLFPARVEAEVIRDESGRVIGRQAIVTRLVVREREREEYSIKH